MRAPKPKLLIRLPAGTIVLPGPIEIYGDVSIHGAKPDVVEGAARAAAKNNIVKTALGKSRN